MEKREIIFSIRLLLFTPQQTPPFAVRNVIIILNIYYMKNLRKNEFVDLLEMNELLFKRKILIIKLNKNDNRKINRDYRPKN